MKDEGKYILFRLLVSLRGLVRLALGLLILMGGFMVILDYILPLGLILCVVGFLGKIYYDRLLFKLTPEDQELFLEM